MEDELEEQQASDSDFLHTVEVCGNLLCNLENSGLNMLPSEKLELQKKLLKIINQSLDYIDYEPED